MRNALRNSMLALSTNHERSWRRTAIPPAVLLWRELLQRPRRTLIAIAEAAMEQSTPGHSALNKRGRLLELQAEALQ
jgi:hypothetical protein